MKIMNYFYVLNSDNKTITVITTGKFGADELEEIELKTRIMANKLKYRIIFDYRQSKILITVARLYYWFSLDYYKNDIMLKHIQTAYIVNKEDWKIYSFFECTCFNSGIPIKVFHEEDFVLKWFK